MTSSTFDPEIRFSPEAGLLDWETVFGRAAPVVVEIGSGNGVFLADEAARHPGNDYLGIERAGEFYVKCRKRIARLGLTNVRCVCAEAEEIFERAIAPGSVSGVICIFSDPWPKRRHRRRRVYRPEFLGLIEHALRPGGTMLFKTDVGWYFNFTATTFRERRGWKIVESGPLAPGAASPGAEPGVMTNFERKGREAGREIWGLLARWQPSDKASEP